MINDITFDKTFIWWDEMKPFTKRIVMLWNPIRRSILKKSVLIFIFLLVLPTLLIYQLIINYAEDMIEEDIISENVANTESIVKRVNNEISSVVLQLHLIAGNREDRSVDVERMYNRSRQAIAQSSIIRSVYYLNNESKVMFESPFVPELDGTSYLYPKLNEIEWTHNYAVSNVIQNYNGEDVVSVGIPVFNERNSFQGALIAEFSQDYLSEIVDSVSTSEGHFGMLIDPNGLVIASTNDSAVGELISNDLPSRQIFKEVSGVSRSIYEGDQSIIAYQTLRDGWGLAYGVSEEIAFAPVRKLSYVLTLSFIGILILSFLFIVAGIRDIVYPIIRLTNYAKAYRKQIFYQEEDSSENLRKDEVGELTRTIISVGNSNYEKQHQLEESERYLNDMIEGIPYGMITINEHAVVTHVNRRFEELVGFSRMELIGRDLAQLPMKHTDEDFMLLKALISEEPSIECESYIIDAKGQRHIVNIGTSRFYNGKNEIIGSIAVLQDISQMKMLESRVKQNDKLALIGQITTGIAHEIKNPLAILTGSSEMLREEVEETTSSDDMKELARDIDQVVKRMKTIVSNFLNFAKVNKADARPLQLKAVIDEVIHLVRFKMKEKNVTVVKHYDTNGEYIGFYDELIQAFLNIILNAADAMKEEGTLTVTLREDENQLHVAFQDTGTGIMASNLEWLFDPFFSTKEDGNGLGLTIARDIIRENNGELTVESVEGVGTTIHCWFHR